MKSIKDITHAFYINLEHRTDRKEYVEEQLKLVGINATRFNAIKLENGAAGCSMSHLKCIETAKKNEWDHVLIVEDDITFLNPGLFVNNINKFLEGHNDWDVVLIGGNIIPPYKKVDFSCVQVVNCQTTTGYLVKSHYFDTLVKNYKEGIIKLLKEPENHKIYAIDKYWFSLQEKDKWYLITPLTVTQKEDYSDIEKKNTNYTRMMVDLEKKWISKQLLGKVEQKPLLGNQLLGNQLLEKVEQKTLLEKVEQKPLMSNSPIKMMINNKTNTKIGMFM
jgi:GR25 family glycosyltransferase involved in LPS biosynthesis